MKVGSLVEYIGVHSSDDFTIQLAIERGLVIPTPRVPYTVRAISERDNGVWILLEEITNPVGNDGNEFDYNINHFRELQPPQSLEFIQELQNELV